MPLRVVLANSLRVSERFAALRPYVSLRSCQGGLKFGVKALEVSCLCRPIWIMLIIFSAYLSQIGMSCYAMVHGSTQRVGKVRTQDG